MRSGPIGFNPNCIYMNQSCPVVANGRYTKTLARNSHGIFWVLRYEVGPDPDLRTNLKSEVGPGYINWVTKRNSHQHARHRDRRRPTHCENTFVEGNGFVIKPTINSTVWLIVCDIGDIWSLRMHRCNWQHELCTRAVTRIGFAKDRLSARMMLTR
ncbi:hypothetical protein BJ165DRAFT_265370 [Panaeolus papilionaceus]|nr:hypothetical protein BJ165DRAFT_265370 [Panaeolus papilionaceus]